MGFPLKGWIRVILSGIYKGTIIIRNLRRVEGSRAFNLFAASIRLMLLYRGPWAGASLQHGCIRV